MNNTNMNGSDVKQSKFVQGMLDASLNGVVMLEPLYDGAEKVVDFVVRVANKAVEEHIGIKPDNAIDKAMSELVPGYKDSGFFDVYVSALETREMQRKELHYKDVSREGWFDLGVAHNDNFVVVTFVNITKYKRYQRQIETAASQLDTIINTSQTGIFLFKPVFSALGDVEDFVFTKANPTLKGYVSQAPNSLVGEYGSRWFPAYKTNGLFDYYNQTYITGKTHRFEFHYNDDGLDVWLDILSTKLEDEVLVTFTDYTTLKKLQLELEASVNELTRSNTNLEEFAYVASHDLQEPLRKIQYFAERLKQMFADNNEANPLLTRMETAIIRMRTLIEDLLAYSRFSAVNNAPERLDLNVLVQEVLNDLETAVNEKNAAITLQLLPTIMGDKLQLRQLFQNVLSNALKYNRPGVPLQISLNSQVLSGNEINEGLPSHEANRKFHVISVTDNGVGFEQMYAQRIFKIFQRLHGRSEYPGTGVGLAIVQKVVANHKGYVFAQGIPNEGATFKLLFPVA